MDGALLASLPIHERRLANGLEVIVREDASAPVVAIVTHVRAGYFDEPDRLIGISHVLEHMYFKGTERRQPGDLARETKQAGGYLNAGTIYDNTTYYTVLPSSALEQGFDIQADALLHSAIDEDELRRELEVILQEARRKLDNAPAVARETLFETMFDVHRIRRWRIGTEDVLRSLTRDDVWTYYRNLYRASNTILVVAGDVKADEVFVLAERYYGAMPAGEPIRDPGPAEPERREFRYREITGDIVHTHVEWGWHAPSALAPESAALDLAAVILGSGRASRLYRRVRERGLVSSIGAHNYTPGSIGVFGVSAQLRPEDTVEALAAIGRTVGSLVDSPPGSAELERARQILEARFARRLETAEGQARLIAEWQALGGWRLADEYMAQLMTMGAEAVHSAARTYLAPENATVLVYRPESAPEVGESAARPLRRAAGAATVARPSAERVEDGVHFYTTENGIPIVVKPRPSSALVSAAICYRGGSILESPELIGATALMARASIKGTESRTAAQLAEEIEGLGGTIAPAGGVDLLDWSTSVPARHFVRAFDLLADAVFAPIFPEDEVERERKVALSDLEQLRDDMAAYPLRMVMSAAFAGHPYGIATEAVDASLRSLERAELARWHVERVLDGVPHVFVVGGVDPDEAAAAVAARLTGLRGSARAIAPPDPPSWPAQSIVVEEPRQKAQTSIVIGFPGVDRNDPAVYALRLLSSGIAGLGGRLFEELRSRRSLAYHVSAYPVARWRGGAFVGTIGTSPERGDEARDGLLDELVRCGREPLPDDDLERAKRYTIGAWQIRSQTNGAQLGDLIGAVLLGRGLEEIREFEQRVQAVTADDIVRVAAGLFDPERAVYGIVRGSLPLS